VCRRLGGLAAALLVAAGLAVPAASASRHMLVGINDEANTLYGNPDQTFPILKQLRTQVLRVNMYWGGRFGVALERPVNAANPNDPAYDWSLYDRTVNYASQYGIKMMFSIYGTPGWANKHAGLNRAPTSLGDLQRFASAAAKRYSGRSRGQDGRRLPKVTFWTAWNEPNNPIFLFPQFRRSGRRWVVQSAIDYAKICNAVYDGIHATKIGGEKVACGVTAPHGNDTPGGFRPSVSPLKFLRAARAAGMRRFDVYAHHPYYGQRTETPTFKPNPKSGTVELGNISTLITQVTKFWGAKRIWITEYGYQTPPERLLAVSNVQQASYLTQAYAIARKNPRIDMMLWFLLKDDTAIASGWQSGLVTATWAHKPSFNAFRNVPRG
jgi:Glycosyl hydrolase catalytic core